MASHRFIHLLLLGLLFWASLSLQAQNLQPKIEQLSIEEGLSDRFVNDFHQDQRGFMWVACNYGLNRYDGKQFKIFTKEGNGLKDNHIKAVRALDAQHLLLLVREDWLTAKKVNQVSFSIFDPILEQAIPFHHFFGQNPPFEETEIQFIGANMLVDQAGHWYHWSDSQELPVQLRRVAQLPHPIEFAQVVAGKVFVQMNRSADTPDLHAIYELHPQKGRLYRGDIYEPAGYPVENLAILYYDEKEDYLFYSANHLRPKHRIGFEAHYRQHTNFLQYKLTKEGASIPFSLQGASVVGGVYHDADARMIFMEDFLVVPEEGHLELFDWQGRLLTKTERLMEQNDVRGYYVDDKQRLWLATANGCFIISFMEDLFQQIYVAPDLDPYKTPRAEGHSMRGILEDGSGALWLCLDRSNQEPPLMRIDVEGNPHPVVSLAQAQKAFFENGKTVPTYAVVADEQGSIWVSDDHYSLYQLDAQSTELIAQYSYEVFKDAAPRTGYTEGPPFANRAIHINEETGLLLIGHNRGLSFLNREKGVLERYTIGTRELDFGIVYCFHENEQGLWIGTNQGLFLYNEEQGTVQQYQQNTPDTAYYIPINTISHIHEDAAGIFWMASAGGGGLVKWNPQTGAYRQYTMADGLSHNVTYAVYEDDYNCLWLSSNRGLMRFNKETEGVDVYLPRDGLPHIEFNTLSHYQAKDGQLYFGGLNGLVSFHPKNIQQHSGRKHSQLQVTRFRKLSSQTGNYEEATTAFYRQAEILLHEAYTAVELEFALLDFFKASENTYAYKLEGLDADWTYTSQNRLVLRGLPYGEYVLHLKGRGQQSGWSPKVLRIPVLVPKPFYLRTWFIGLCIFGALFFLWGIATWRLRRLQKSKAELEQKVAARTQTIAQQAEELKELDKYKSRFFANISHELRTPLTLILGPLSQLRKAQDNEVLEVMQRNGIQLLSLVEEILDLSKLEAQKLELEEEPTFVRAFFQRLCSNYESAASYKQIHWHFEAKDIGDMQLYLDPAKVEKIVHNLLSNALKFTPLGGKISLRLENQTHYLCLSVEDTGAGIHPADLKYVFDRFYQAKLPGRKAQGGTGIGLALAKELAELMGGRLSVKSQLGQGSCFTLHLPKELAFVEEVAPETELLREESAVPSAPVSLSEGAQILIVEDHPDMQRFVQSIVGAHYAVQVLGDGQAAWDYLKTGAEVELIISDVMMPVMDGFQLLEKLKGSDDFRQIPVIMLTARAALEDKLKALRIGVDDYLTKPFVAEELLLRVQNLLQNYKARQSWAEEAEEEGEAAEQEGPPEESPQISQEDQAWLEAVEQTCKNYCGNTNFSITWLAEELHISERQLRRKLKKLTGLTPQKYLSLIRLQLARTLMEERKYNTVSQVMYHVGFQKSSYFARLFKEQFGSSPSTYIKSNHVT